MAGQKASRWMRPLAVLPLVLYRLLAVLTLILARLLRTLALALLVLERLGQPKRPPPELAVAAGLLGWEEDEEVVAAELEVLLSQEGRKAETRCMMGG